MIQKLGLSYRGDGNRCRKGFEIDKYMIEWEGRREQREGLDGKEYIRKGGRKEVKGWGRKSKDGVGVGGL